MTKTARMLRLREQDKGPARRTAGMREVKPKIKQKHVMARYEPAKIQEQQIKVGSRRLDLQPLRPKDCKQTMGKERR